MSFNLNKLVQPECGAPNPLVAAAQQIATVGKSSGSIPMTSLSRLRAQQAGQSSLSAQRISMNFSKEFAQQAPVVGSLMRTIVPSTSSIAGPSQVQQQLHDTQNQLNATSLNMTMQQQQTLHPMHYLRPEQYGNFTTQAHFQQQQQPDVGDQLEAKYRNDMIAQEKKESLNKEQIKADFVDDVEFWQSLAQFYVGPSTFNNIAQSRAQDKANKDKQHSLSGEKNDDKTNTDEQDNAQEEKEAEVTTQNSEQFSRLFGRNLEYTFDERNPLKDKFEDPFAEGMKRLEMGDIPSAVLLFEAAVQLEPENVLAWQYLGTTQAQNEQDKSAIDAFEACLKFDPSNQVARLAMAASLVNEMQYAEACDQLIEWLSRHEKYGPGMSMDEYKRFIDSLKNDATLNSYATNLGEKHYEYVRDKFFQAARMAPTNPDPEVQNSLGVIFNMRGEYDKAVDCFKAALSVSSEDSLLWNRLGATLSNGNKANEAIIAYRRALDISPGFLRARYNLAICLIHLNLYEEAARQLLQILEIQAAGGGGATAASSSESPAVRTRSITSVSVWTTLRTVATLMNRPDLEADIEAQNLSVCKEKFFAASPAAE